MHVRVYSDHPGAELIAICDTDGERLKGIAETYRVKNYYTDFGELLENEEIQGVSIATPDFAHTEIAIEAARAGKQILLEKPMATTVEDCEKILSAVKAEGVKLMVDFHNRWNPPFFKAKKAIEEGELGEPVMAYARLSDTIMIPTKVIKWASKSSVEWFVGSHAVDLVQWLIADEVIKVYAVSSSKVLKGMGIDTPDFYQATLEFRNGATAIVENNWILPESAPNIIDFKLELVGTKGVIYADASHHRVLQKYTQESASYPDVIICPTIYGKPKGFAPESIRYFADCVIKDEKPMVTGEDGLAVTKIVCAILESAETGKPVML